MVEVVVQLENTHPSLETRGLGYDGVVRFVEGLSEAPKHGGQGEIELGQAVPRCGVENSRFSLSPLSRYASTVTDPEICRVQVQRTVGGKVVSMALFVISYRFIESVYISISSRFDL